MRSENGSGSDSGRKTLFMAIAAAVLIHALLLVMFRLSEQEKMTDEKKLLKVNPIELHDPENRNIAVWIKNHDPALMLSPGNPGGYGSVLSSRRQRKTLEDLPSPPQLSMSRGAEKQVDVRRTAHGSSAFELPGDTFDLQGNSSAGREKQNSGAVLFQNKYNGSVLQQLKKMLTDLPAVKKQISPETVTRLSILPPRFSGMLPRIETDTLCGVKELDNLAVQAARCYLEIDPVGGSGYGEMIFFWHKILSENSGAKVKK